MKRRLVWAAEDDCDDRFFLDRCLAAYDSDLQFELFEDGAALIEQSQRQDIETPDLIISDVKMPLVDGFELAKWIRGQPSFSRSKLVLLSSSGEPSDLERARQLATPYFIKPLDVEELQQLVHQILDQVFGR